MQVIQKVIGFVWSAIFVVNILALDINDKTPILYPINPQTPTAYYQVWDYVSANDLEKITIHYTIPYTKELRKNIDDSIKKASQEYRYQYPEYFNYYQASKYESKTTSTGFDIILTFEPVDSTVTYEMKSEAIESAKEVHDHLRNEGVLKDSMSERERAWVIVQWVCDNTEYKKENNALCHTAYSVFVNKTGVCDALSAATELLLRLEGIECHGEIGKVGDEPHHWTIASLDGETVAIDTTWCNKKDGPNDQYFAIDLDTFYETHKPS